VIVTLESTDKIVTLVTTDGPIRARIWEGQTASGIPCHAYITRIAVSVHADASDFERELLKQQRPTPEVAAIPTRLVI
jgi:hypothetical protein